MNCKQYEKLVVSLCRQKSKLRFQATRMQCVQGHIDSLFFLDIHIKTFYIMAAKLDSLDYKILKMLSLNARKPYLEIARACNVSGAAIHQRIQKLYNMGVIKGSISLINPASVGYETCAYIGFFLNDPSKFDEVVARLKTVPEVVECYFTTGKYDMFVKLYAQNNDHLLQVIHDQFLKMGLGRSETLITFKEVFKRQIPIEPEGNGEVKN